MKASNGSARHRLLAFLPVLALLGYLGGMAYSQVADPCALYPHQSARIPAGTPTAQLVTGKLGYEIDVCRVVLSVTGSGSAGTPVVETFYSGGEANASATPCATATTGGPGAVATMGAIGLNTNAFNSGSADKTLYHVPPVTAGFPVDFCGLMAGGTGLTGSIDYVMIKP